MLDLVRPPRGRDVRRFVAFIALAISLPRLDILGSFFSRFLALDVIPAQVIGISLTVLAVLLLATLNKRLTWYGRLVAVVACSLHAAMGVDALSGSTTSALVEFVVAYALFGEIIAHE